MRAGRQGMTLIEVLGALVLLSTLLVGMLVANGRFVRQLSRAQTKAQAAEAADKLLTSWWQDRSRFPRQGQGQIEGAGTKGATFSWRTEVMANDQADTLGVQVVALEILDPQAPEQPLVHVEVLLPPPAPPQAETQDAQP